MNNEDPPVVGMLVGIEVFDFLLFLGLPFRSQEATATKLSKNPKRPVVIEFRKLCRESLF